MKNKAFIVGCLIIAGIFAVIVQLILPAPAAAQAQMADSDAGISNAKIGVVNIQRIFQQCRTNAEYRQQAAEEQNQAIAELDKLSKEIEAQKAALRILKAGSTDYLELMQEILKKQGELEAQNEFIKQRFAFKDQQWTTKLYKDILGLINEVAAQKGLVLVLEQSDTQHLDSSNANELMLTIRTHKVLYSGGCLDITDEVMARLDADK
ncbi:OmpH family outer membrane protein [Planctomycetota bacterium]